MNQHATTRSGFTLAPFPFEQKFCYGSVPVPTGRRVSFELVPFTMKEIVQVNVARKYYIYKYYISIFFRRIFNTGKIEAEI